MCLVHVILSFIEKQLQHVNNISKCVGHSLAGSVDTHRLVSLSHPTASSLSLVSVMSQNTRQDALLPDIVHFGFSYIRTSIGAHLDHFSAEFLDNS